MRHLYSALFYLLTPLLLLRLAMRARKAPAYWQRWGERFGFYRRPQAQQLIWFHTVSVGEAEAAFPLIKAVAQQHPEQKILVTSTTPTGSARVKAMFGEEVEHVYLPYDTPGAMRRFYRCFKPKIAIILETEIWPNMLFQAQRRGVPTLIVNARLSARSAARYAKISAFSSLVFNTITHVCAQTEASAERFVQLGLAKNKLSVPGNIKFDIEMPASLHEQAESIRRDVFKQRPSWIAASTHEGEDEIILAAFSSIKKVIPEALLVLVPRHPERFNAVAKKCQAQAFSLTRRSDAKQGVVNSDVFLVDSVGELKLYYATVDIAFVGGSLVPTGGHNMLEPATLARPILFGPHVFNFAEISERLLADKAALQVASADELASKVIELLGNSEKRSEMGEAAAAFVSQNKGAVEAVRLKISGLLAS